MKKFFLIFALLGLFLLVACGDVDDVTTTERTTTATTEQTSPGTTEELPDLTDTDQLPDTTTTE